MKSLMKFFGDIACWGDVVLKQFSTFLGRSYLVLDIFLQQHVIPVSSFLKLSPMGFLQWVIIVVVGLFSLVIFCKKPMEGLTGEEKAPARYRMRLGIWLALSAVSYEFYYANQWVFLHFTNLAQGSPGFTLLIQGLWQSVGFAGVGALIYSLWSMENVLAHPEGSIAMIRIARAIQEGARAYLTRQYMSIGVVGFIVGGALWWWLSFTAAIGFFLGAGFSALSGFLGMFISVRGNVRTAQGARALSGDENLVQTIENIHGKKIINHRFIRAFSIAVRSGAATGFFVNGLALLILMFFMLFLSRDLEKIAIPLVSMGFGASLISIFARLGGGIFTKGADVGADLVGKIEAGIPEDDPRNPAVIADNVGDNVGDCAGMSADLFETYIVTLVASVQASLLLRFQFPSHLSADVTNGLLLTAISVPLAIGMIGLISSMVGMWFVRLKKTIMGALYKGLTVSAVLCAILSTLMLYIIDDGGLFQNFFQVPVGGLVQCVYTGLVVTGALMWLTEYYTSTAYRPVQSIARASTTGAGTNVIAGLAISMEACFTPVLVITGGILYAWYHGGLFGISLAATSMLSLMGMIITIDAYGPVTDNAGGIAEMAQLPSDVRIITDQLDAVGNTTKAVTKGYAIGSAALAVLVLFSVYVDDVQHYLHLDNLSFDLRDPFVIAGLLLGGSLPYLFSALSMRAVGRAAGSIVMEVRRQFATIKNIMSYGQPKADGTISEEGKPDYARAVDILTKASIRAMIVPSLLPILFPAALYGGIRWGYPWFVGSSPHVLVVAKTAAATLLGGFLLGLITTGFFLALSMTSGGGAWDNAKKYVELGHYGGKGSDTHNATIVGDTVGDPYKDTAGPAINPLIKIVLLVSLLLLVLS